MPTRQLPLYLLSLCLLGGPAQAATFYVQQSAGDDANPGDAWGAGHALASIQRGLDLARANPGGDTVLVAAGHYPESIRLPGEVLLQGGYPETGGDQTDPEAHPTIIDGERRRVPVRIVGVSGLQIYGFHIVRGLNAGRVAGGVGGGIAVSDAHEVYIIGNTLADNQASLAGGGLGVSNASGVVVIGNRLRANRAPEGGGMKCYQVSGRLLAAGNRILGNTATDGGGGVSATYCGLDMLGNTLADNLALRGGGLHLGGYAQATFDQGRVHGNQAEEDGGGAYVAGKSTLTLGKTLFQDNRAGQQGGGLFLNPLSASELVNTVVSGNVAGNHGGGLAISVQSNLNVSNSTIADNRAGGLGGGLYLGSGAYQARIRNAIFWGNRAQAVPAGDNDQITREGYGSLEVSHSDVAGGWEGSGNIDAAPRWALPGQDYHLTRASPARDAGAADGAPVEDLDGTPRPYGAGVDMGAYEWTPGPDLTGTWEQLELGPDGQTLAAGFTLRNLSAQYATSGFRTAFHLSDDGRAPTGEPFLIVHTPKGLAGDGRRSLDIRHTFPTPVAGRHVLAIIDDRQAVREVDERNNSPAALLP